MVYFDHNATTPLHPEVIKTMQETMMDFGNPSSLHGYGRIARDKVEEARERVASFIGASAEEIIFMGSGSEANNTVLQNMTCNQFHSCLINQTDKKPSVFTSVIEHPCILETAKCLSDRGNQVAFLEVNPDGKVKIDQLKEQIGQETGLVSVMMVNNETGTIQDIKALAQIAHENGALFHTDGIQAVGKMPVDVKELDVDFLSLSGHKIYGPKGIGALYVKKGTTFCPLIRGGHQEKGRRAGTENTLGIIALGKAVEMRALEMEDETKRLTSFRSMMKQGIIDNIPDVKFLGHQDDCVQTTLNASFEGAEGEAILLYLDLEGVAVSTGSACASGSLDPSHVLLAMGLEPEWAHGSIRISMGRETTEQEVEYFIEKLTSTIQRVRRMSTIYQGRN